MPWEVVAYFRWAGVESDKVEYAEQFSTFKKARAAARAWTQNGIEIAREFGAFTFVPSFSIHYVQLQEITDGE